MINLLLERFYLGTKYTVGRLAVDGMYLCDTLEDVVRDLNKDGDLDESGEGKIPHFTAIPFGRYRVIVTRSPKFKRELPEILKVHDFTSIRIHAGNDIDDTDGCILVGENKIKGHLVRSRYWETQLVERLKYFLMYGHELYINIV
jgi:hypothetical protein